MGNCSVSKAQNQIKFIGQKQKLFILFDTSMSYQTADCKISSYKIQIKVLLYFRIFKLRRNQKGVKVTTSLISNKAGT